MANPSLMPLNDVGSADGDFTTFYGVHRPPLRKALALALGDLGLAEEAVDEALARAFLKWDELSQYEKPEGWVYRVGLNWARDGFRKRRYEILSEIDPDSVRSETKPVDVDLIEAVGKLSERLRSVVVARYYLDWSTLEVATALKIPEGTVKSRLSRALNQLHAELEE